MPNAIGPHPCIISQALETGSQMAFGRCSGRMKGRAAEPVHPRADIPYSFIPLCDEDCSVWILMPPYLTMMAVAHL